MFDRKSGKTIKTHLFCGVLPFSGYTFAEFVLNQKLESFINSHQRMWAYFGGVTPYVVIDNLKSGVTKAHLYDPDINKTYCEYADHDGFAVMPARPYKPRDKAAVESTIGAIQRSFYQEYRDRIFYDLDTLNRVFRDFLEIFNDRVMKDHGVSRKERFEVEKPKLAPLPSGRYVMKTWKKAKVHPDSTVQVNHNFYSLPHKHIGKVVNVRISKDLIEIFDDSSESLAVHRRLSGKGKKSINPGHYPEEKVQQAQFDLTKAKAKAQSIGPKMSELIHKMFSSNRPLASLRAVQGMLACIKLKDIGGQDMEHAAAQCLLFNKHRVKFFKGCALQHRVSSKSKKDLSPSRDLDSIHLHHPRIKEDEDDRTSKEAVCKAASSWDYGAFRT